MIVIADRAGRDHLTQGFARRLAGTIESASRAITENPTGVSAIGVSATGVTATGVTAIVPAELPDRPEPIPKLNSWVAWAGFGIVLALIILTAVFFGMRW